MSAELYLDPLTAAIFKDSARGLTFSASISVDIVIGQSTGIGIYNPATATTIYPETQTALAAFRGIVTEKQSSDRIQVGDVWWAVNPDLLASRPKVGDRVTDDNGVIWFITAVGDPDPIQALTRVYSRRSSAP